MKKYISGSLLAIVIIITSFLVANAQSVTISPTVIANLQRQIIYLTEQLTRLKATLGVTSTTGGVAGIGYDLAIKDGTLTPDGVQLNLCNESSGRVLSTFPLLVTFNLQNRGFDAMDQNHQGDPSLITPGTCRTITYPYDYWNYVFDQATIATVIVAVKLDPNNTYQEINETNNNLTITYHVPDVDLFVVDGKFRSDGSIYYSVCNSGSVTPSPRITFDVQTEIKIDGIVQQMATDIPDYFNSSNVFNGCIYVNTGSGLTNYSSTVNHSAEVTIDSDNRVSETDENNNRLVFSNAIPTPEIYYPPTSYHLNPSDPNYTWDGYPTYRFDPVTGNAIFYLIKGNYDHLSFFDRFSNSVALKLISAENPDQAYAIKDMRINRSLETSNFEFNPWYAGSYAIASDSHVDGVFVPDGRYLIQICNDADINRCDTTDVYLKIIDDPSKRYGVKMVWPNGGEVLTTGQTYPIRWQEFNLSDSNQYRIDFILVPEYHGKNLIASISSNGPNEFFWMLPENLPSGRYKIAVSCGIENRYDLYCNYLDENNKSVDISDDWFEIVAPVTPTRPPTITPVPILTPAPPLVVIQPPATSTRSFTVLYPNGLNDMLYHGQTNTIRWSSTNLPASTPIQIEFIPSDTRQFHHTITNLTNTGSYDLNLRQDFDIKSFPSGYYLLEVRAYIDGQFISDRSDNLFQILSTSKSQVDSSTQYAAVLMSLRDTLEVLAKQLSLSR